MNFRSNVHFFTECSFLESHGLPVRLYSAMLLIIHFTPTTPYYETCHYWYKYNFMINRPCTINLLISQANLKLDLLRTVPLLQPKSPVIKDLLTPLVRLLEEAMGNQKTVCFQCRRQAEVFLLSVIQLEGLSRFVTVNKQEVGGQVLHHIYQRLQEAFIEMDQNRGYCINIREMQDEIEM